MLHLATVMRIRYVSAWEKHFNLMKVHILVLFMLVSLVGFGQSDQASRFYVYWGWNGSAYTKSDISFEGELYNFTLHNAAADDRPTSFTLDNYFNPEKFSTPQFNVRLGYFISDKYDISIGLDHMKYVLNQGQDVSITGQISETNFLYGGTYDNDIITVRRSFVKYEHTDGLNYINVELRRRDFIGRWKTFELYVSEGLGLGMVMPRTDAAVLNRQRHDAYHLSGYGINLVSALRVHFLKHFFVMPELKGGFINLPDVRISPDKNEKANQHFFFTQWNVVFGATINI